MTDNKIDGDIKLCQFCKEKETGGYECTIQQIHVILPVCAEHSMFIQIACHFSPMMPLMPNPLKCAICKGDKVDKWLIVETQTKNYYIIFCSEKCLVLHRRRSKGNCNNCNNPLKKTIFCSGCRTAEYCSAKCQKEHWEISHKENCKEYGKETRAYMYAQKLKRSCYNCFKSSSTEDYMKCSGCKITYYCSSECQKEHWEKEHKLQCKKLK